MDPVVDVLYIFQRGKGYLLQLGKPCFVRAIPQQHGIGLQPISAGASRFLEVSLGAVGDIGMHHKTHVGLVDAHAESVGAHHHAGASGLPFLLAVGARLCSQTGVVEGGRYSRRPQ